MKTMAKTRTTPTFLEAQLPRLTIWCRVASRTARVLMAAIVVRIEEERRVADLTATRTRC